MLKAVKKFGVIITIAILFAFFAFSIVELVHPAPKYEDYCRYDMKPFEQYRDNCTEMDIPKEYQDDCSSRGGYIEYEYTQGCPSSYTCNTCQKEFDVAGQDHRLVGFIVTSILGIIAIIVGMYVSVKEEVLEWVFSGLIIGGIISIFIGTIMYFRDMGRFVKPFVFLAEIGLIIWIAVRTLKK